MFKAPSLVLPPLLLLCLLAPPASGQGGSAQGDGTAITPGEAAGLLAFKAGLSNGADHLPGWTNGSSPCGWEGVVCASSHVTELRLGGTGLNGTIAANSLSQLSYLAGLDLSGNLLHGKVPDDWNAPGALPALLYAGLEANQLTGVPVGWGAKGCTGLEGVLLGRNALASAPPGLAFKQLQLLDLTLNAINDSIPTAGPGAWALNSSATVLLQPQAAAASFCGQVPPSPAFLYNDSRHQYPLSNSLGSCYAKPGSCTPPGRGGTVTLAGTNLYDAALLEGATVWDTVSQNPQAPITPQHASTTVLALPCYAAGSPVGGYLGSDVAFQRPAWGSAEGAPAVVAQPPLYQAQQQQQQQCYTASGTGSAYWQVDLGTSQNLSMVVLGVGGSGLAGVVITVGESPDPGGEPCATDIGASDPAANRMIVVLCPTQGRYLRITGSIISLCSVQVYGPASSAAVNKRIHFTDTEEAFSGPVISGIYTGPSTFNNTGTSCRGDPLAAFALDLGYRAPVAAVRFWGFTNLDSVYLADASLNAGDGSLPPVGHACALGYGVRPQQLPPSPGSKPPPVMLIGDNAGAFDCGGAFGRYIIARGGGSAMGIDGIEVFLASQPDGTPSYSPSPSPPPPSSPSPPPYSPAPPVPASSGSSSAGAIVGGAVGAAVAVAAVLAAGWWLWRRRRRRLAQDPEAAYKSSSSHGAPPPENRKCYSHGPGSQGSAQNGGAEGDGRKSTDPLLALVVNKLESKRTLAAAAAVAAAGQAGGPPAAAAGELGSPWQQGTSPRDCLRSGSLPLEIDMRPWVIPFEDLEIHRLIGEGSYGKVYLAKWHETQVAVKLLLNTGVPVEDLDSAAEMAVSLSNPILANLQQEACLNAALRHPNIVGFLGVCPTPPCVISEYCSRGSLMDVLRSARHSPAKAKQLDWPRRLQMAIDAAKGILYLHTHSPPIIHRDLKSPNLLVDVHWRVKVCDFNLSKIMESSAPGSSGASLMNPRWLAPEILSGQPATFASDVWSFGTVLWELATWEMPWGLINPWQVVNALMAGGRLQFPPGSELPGDGGGFSELEDYIALVHQCWAQDPQERPPLSEVIARLREMLTRAMQGIKRGAGGGA